MTSPESEGSIEDDDFTTRAPRSTQRLTTVELDVPVATTLGRTDYFGSILLPPRIRSETS